MPASTAQPTAVLETPFGPVRATLQSENTCYVANDCRNTDSYNTGGPLVIRDRPAYINAHLYWVDAVPTWPNGADADSIIEPAAWSARQRMENGRRTYTASFSPKWYASAMDGATYFMAVDVTGPATVAKVEAAIIAAVTAWATPELRAAAAGHVDAENRATIRAAADRIEASAADLRAIADDPAPCPSYYSVRDRAERAVKGY